MRIGFAHARFHHQTHRAVLLRVSVTDATLKAVGYGEVIPRIYLTGETTEGVFQWIRRHGPEWIGFDLSKDPRPALRALFDQVQTKGGIAAFSGLDVAIHDLWSQVTGRGLVSLLGGPVKPVQSRPLSGPVGLGMLQKPQILGFYAMGFRRIKIKVSNLYDWQKLIKTLPQSTRFPVQWILDANGAFSWEDARALVERAGSLGIAAVEEPLARSESSFKQIKELSQQTTGSMKVIVDEHLCTLEDGLRWQGTSVVRNLRLAKIGGFTGLIAHLALLDRGGAQVMLGALVGESPLLEAATRVGLGLTPTVFTESSFGNLLLKKTPFFRRDQGMLASMALPNALEPLDLDCLGLGVVMDEAVVMKYQNRSLKL